METRGVAGLAVVLACLLTSPAHSHPQYWMSRGNSKTCTDHPALTIPAGKYGNHGVAVLQSGITFTVSVGGVATTSMCPGAAHTIEVAFPAGASRQGLLTASTGTFANAYTGTGAKSCNNREVLSDKAAVDYTDAPSYTSTLTLPCTATGSVVLYVTSAGFLNDNFNENTVTLPVSAACATAACTPPSLPPPPSPKPLPPPHPPLTPGSFAPPPSPPHAPPSPAPPMPPPVAPPLSPALPPPTPAAPGAPPPTVVGNLSAGACTVSSLGYQCQGPLGTLMVHWSLGVAPPDLHSTGRRRLAADSNATTTTTDSTSNVGMLHMAVVGPTTGYVAVAFAQNPGQMGGSDIVLGWVASDGTTHVGTYYATGEALSANNQVLPSWASRTAVEQAGGSTTLRFSRPLVTSLAKVSPTLDSTTGVSLNWALGSNGQTALTEHVAAGGAVINLDNGAVADAANPILPWIRAHGALMSAAWILLLPLGTLLPAHRWALNDAMWGSRHVWFYLHIAFQLTGVAALIAGYIIAYLQMSSDTTMLGSAHEILGGCVMGLAGLQVILGFVRPAPGPSTVRTVWNHLHHSLGRLSIVAAWTNIYIGIVIFHRGFKESLVKWIVPVAVINGLLVLAAVLLLVFRSKHEARYADAALRQKTYEATEEGKSGMTASSSAQDDHSDHNPATRLSVGEPRL